jgi:SAM-dependent methyltransferase
MPDNREHWYDGWFYDRLIAPNQDRLFLRIKDLIRPGSTVIDVGCGTGRLAFMLADDCAHVTGIELSESNVKRARRALSRSPHPGMSFEHASVAEILNEGQKKFDYAVMTYVLHEVPEQMREELLGEVFRLARTIILGDYLVPRPRGFWSFLNRVVERAAGQDHYSNFKSFVAKGGLRGLVQKLPVEVLHDLPNMPPTAHIVVLQPSQT